MHTAFFGGVRRFLFKIFPLGFWTLELQLSSILRTSSTLIHDPSLPLAVEVCCILSSPTKILTIINKYLDKNRYLDKNPPYLLVPSSPTLIITTISFIHPFAVFIDHLFRLTNFVLGHPLPTKHHLLFHLLPNLYSSPSLSSFTSPVSTTSSLLVLLVLLEHSNSSSQSERKYCPTIFSSHTESGLLSFRYVQSIYLLLFLLPSF